MDELKIDPSKQQFSDGIQLFHDKEISLKHKNFIFARNGSGKSTFSAYLKEQFSSNYDVRVFDGFESVLGENDRLNAFALAVNAGDNEATIKQKESEIQTKQSLLSLVTAEIDDSDSANLKAKKISASNLVREVDGALENFYSQSAASIKKMSNPQISKPTYNKNDFKKEISQAAMLQDLELAQLKKTVESEELVVSEITWKPINLSAYLTSTNEILASRVEEKTRINRLQGNQERINFAAEGMRIHDHKDGEICAFCGNAISLETFQELEAYFSADEVAALRNRISTGKQKVTQLTKLIRNTEWAKTGFYPTFQEDAADVWNTLNEQKTVLLSFCERLEAALEDKQKNLFNMLDPLNVDVPEDFDFSAYNELVAANTKYGETLTANKTDAQNKLRYHTIQRLLDKFKYDAVRMNLVNAQEAEKTANAAFEQKLSKKIALEEAIQKLNDEIEQLKPKAEAQAVEHINGRLKGAVPWQLDYSEDEDTGYYRVSQSVAGALKFRGVKELSTGEKNLIAFLYFLEKLAETGSQQARLPKLIIFDDPMNSNDSDMQYLIITELQKLYSGNQRERFDAQKDFLLIMTHNIHFYLNVPPHGSYKDDKGRTKYDKNNFYHIRNGNFIHINNVKQDMQTNYDALWLELGDLAEHEYTNSMLNSMRRIIETYIEFTGVNPNKFYQNNEQYIKLFNVNSHSAIDSLSAQSFTETAPELVNIFRQIFEDNDAKEHFEAHWKSGEDLK